MIVNVITDEFGDVIGVFDSEKNVREIMNEIDNRIFGVFKNTPVELNKLPEFKTHYEPMVEAAVKLKDGRIITGKRHGGIGRRIMLLTGYSDLLSGSEAGFVDKDGEFYTREEALVCAIANDQIKGGKTIASGILTTKDLW